MNFSAKKVQFGLSLALLFFLPSLGFTDVISVGLNQFGQAVTPAAVSNAVSVEAGRDYSFAIGTNGTVIGWGNASDGRLSPSIASGIVSISCGTYHTLGLKSDGTVTAWGFKGNGILNVPAGLGDVLAVAAGGYHSLAVKRDGTVVGWGYAGDGRTVAPASLTDVVGIDAGRDYSVALKSDGTVVAWGLNDVGQTNVPVGLSGVIALSAGEAHTLALKNDGTVVAWGWNTNGQCNVPAGLTGVVKVSAGSQHSLALKSDGSIVSWGSNAKGQRNLSGNGYRGIAAGGFHSVALRGAGPLITSQPVSKTVIAGAAVSFAVAATGSNLSYQWQFNGADLPGQTAAILSIAEADRPHAGVYTVRVSNANGSTLSANAVLIVRGLQQLSAPQVLAGGGLRLLFGDAHGDPVSAPNVSRYGVEVSEDFQTWNRLDVPLQLVNGLIQIVDMDAANHTKRFYRVREK